MTMRRSKIIPPEPNEGDTALQTDATTSIVGYRLRRAQLSVFQKFLAVFDELKLRPAEYSVLVLIGDNPGRKQTEIAEVLGLRPLGQSAPCRPAEAARPARPAPAPYRPV